MPETVAKRRKRPLIEVDKDTIPVLIEGGARVVVWNKFLGGKSQDYITLLAGPYSDFIIHHSKPHPFIVLANRTMIPDPPPQGLQASHYRPS